MVPVGYDSNVLENGYLLALAQQLEEFFLGQQSARFKKLYPGPQCRSRVYNHGDPRVLATGLVAGALDIPSRAAGRSERTISCSGRRFSSETSRNATPIPRKGQQTRTSPCTSARNPPSSSPRSTAPTGNVAVVSRSNHSSSSRWSLPQVRMFVSPTEFCAPLTLVARTSAAGNWTTGSAEVANPPS